MDVRVVSYDPTWSQSFVREHRLLAGVFGDSVLRIHHIGSTSVPGLVAKPIIDILIEAASLAELDRRSAAMASIGYEALGEYGTPAGATSARAARRGPTTSTPSRTAIRTSRATSPSATTCAPIPRWRPNTDA